MDAIIVGAVDLSSIRDDPLPDGPTCRTAGCHAVNCRRLVQAGLPVTSQLVQTAREVPLLVAASSKAPLENIRRLEEHGAEVVTHSARIRGGEALRH